MPLYRYKAVSAEGELLEGEMESADQAAVITSLQDSGHTPIRAEQAGATRLGPLLRRAPGRPRRVARREVTLFTQGLAALLHAGLPLDRALQIMIDVADDSRLRRLTENIQEAVRSGTALSSALDAQQEPFSRFYISLVRAAEAAGTLESGLARLVAYLDRAKALRESVISALLYPAILVMVASVSLVIILGYVVPQFTQLFSDVGRALPAATQAVIALAELLRTYGWMLALAGIVLALLMRIQLSRSRTRYRWDRRFLRVPLVGDLLKKMDMARLCRSLGTLLANGVPLLSALSIAKDSLSNSVLVEAIEAAGDNVKGGRSLADEMLSAGLFPALGLQMIKVGEETGQLDEMLLRVADVYDREVATAVQRMLTLLEPALIIGLGLLIAGIIISILVGILSVNEIPL
ncbi:MAG: type II secretion system F family protein [Acidiferrobacterales bacterium]